VGCGGVGYSVVRAAGRPAGKFGREQLPPAEKNPRTDYLSAIALSRMNRPREGLEYYLKAIQADPVLKFRGNLDPEIQILYKQNNVKSTTYDS